MAKIFEPFGNRVWVRRLANPEDERTEGGLYKPETAQEKPQQGVVLAAGPGVYVNGLLISTNVKAGELVAFPKYSGNELSVGGEVTLILEEDQLLGRIRDDGRPADVEAETSENGQTA